MAWLFSSRIVCYESSIQLFDEEARDSPEFHKKTFELMSDLLRKYPSDYSINDVKIFVKNLINHVENSDISQYKKSFLSYFFKLLDFLFLEKNFKKDEFLAEFKKYYQEYIDNDEQSISQVIVSLIFLDYSNDDEVNSFCEKYSPYISSHFMEQLLMYHISDVNDWKQQLFLLKSKPFITHYDSEIINEIINFSPSTFDNPILGVFVALALSTPIFNRQILIDVASKIPFEDNGKKSPTLLIAYLISGNYEKLINSAFELTDDSFFEFATISLLRFFNVPQLTQNSFQLVVRRYCQLLASFGEDFEEIIDTYTKSLINGHKAEHDLYIQILMLLKKKLFTEVKIVLNRDFPKEESYYIISKVVEELVKDSKILSDMNPDDNVTLSSQVLVRILDILNDLYNVLNKENQGKSKQQDESEEDTEKRKKEIVEAMKDFKDAMLQTIYQTFKLPYFPGYLEKMENKA